MVQYIQMCKKMEKYGRGGNEVKAKQKNKTKRILALVLASIMIVPGNMPSVFATETTGEEVTAMTIDVNYEAGSRTEHPRPDWKREQWMNLNGWWDFCFDESEVGKTEKWYNGGKSFDKQINVPYPWESELSGIGATDYRGQAWYQRTIELDDAWLNDRVFINFGAVDAKCTVYVNGVEVGSHDGGYTNFEFDITEYVNAGTNTLTVWVEDKAVYGDNTYTALVGKQGHEAPCGYTHTGGIWQTVYLESRSATYLDYAHANPDIDESQVVFDLKLNSALTQSVTVSYEFESRIWDEKQSADVLTGSSFSGSQMIEVSAGENVISLDAIAIDDVKLWDDVSPNLYYGTITLTDADGNVLDQVNTYFGMREVSTEHYDDREYRYIYVNGKPVFLSGLLDQGFWAEGIYTAPSEGALKDDVLDMKELGFNMIRKHLKVEDPLQYYWADKLGMYIWQDMPHATAMNATEIGGEAPGRALYEATLKDMLNRDYNHPSVMAVMLFNETWGITRPGNQAADGMTTQDWQIYLYDYAKGINPNLLVEDMSPNKADHIQPTDLNTFHMYPKGYLTTKNLVNTIYYSTEPGSTHNFVAGFNQDGDPWLNSEYGGVAAHDGDWDVSWCFKYMTDIQRQYDMLNGFVYTEPYDIEYERNGILTYDRREKLFPYGEVAYGGDMSIKDLTQANYVGIDVDPAKVMDLGATYSAEAVGVNWSGDTFENAVMKWRFDATDVYGNYISTGINGEFDIEYPAYTAEYNTIEFTLPNQKCVGTITVWIEVDGEKIAKNFVNVIVTDDLYSSKVEYLNDKSVVLRNNAATATATGTDTLDYTYKVPADFAMADLSNLRVIAEISSLKEVTTNNGIENAAASQTTKGSERASDLTVWVNGVEVDTVYLPDNPRDIRGTLTLAEDFNGGASAADFGYLVNVRVPQDKMAEVQAAIEADGEIKVSYGVKEGASNSNGLRVYADTTGRYAVSPTVILNPTDMISDAGKITPVESNYTAQAMLQDGGTMSVRGGAYEVSLSDGILSLGEEKVNVGAGEHLVSVKLFDDHIQVYVDNNPEAVIDIYDYSAYTANTVQVTNGSELVVAPETYSAKEAILVDSVSLVKEPNKTEYVVGDELDLTGLVLNVVYSDGSSADVSDISAMVASGYDMSQTGDQTVTVEYEGKTVAYSISVVEKDKTDLNMRITGISLKIQNDITILFKTKTSVVDATYTGIYAVVSHEVDNGQIMTQTIEGKLDQAGTAYEFEYTGVAAKQIGDFMDVVVYAYDSEGDLVTGGILEDYGIKKYCDNQLAKTDEQLTAMGLSVAKQQCFRTLLVDLLNYGAEAQKYFTYKVDVLANATLTEEQKAYASSDSVLDSLVNITGKTNLIENPTAVWKTAQIQLLNKVVVRAKFAYEGDVNNLKVLVNVENGSSYEVTEFTVADTNQYYVCFDGITASQFGTALEFKVIEGDTVISDTLRYSVESYASKYKDADKEGAVVSAMMKYGKAAYAYVNTK